MNTYRRDHLLWLKNLDEVQLIHVVFRNCVTASYFLSQPTSEIHWSYATACEELKNRGRNDLVKLAYRLAILETRNEDPFPGEGLEEVLKEAGYVLAPKNRKGQGQPVQGTLDL